MKQSFTRLFPDYAAKFEAAKTQEEVLRIQDEFMSVQQEKLRVALGREKKQGEAEFSIPITVSPEELEKLINAEGFEIEKQVQYLLDGLERISGMEGEDEEKIAAQMLNFGALAISLLSGDVIGDLLAKIAVITGEVLTAVTVIGLAVVGASVVVICAAIAVIAIVIPILYYMFKPAMCIMFLINKLDQNLVFKDSYNVHGKPSLITDEIGSAVEKNSGETFASGGLFITSKRSKALIGTQFGMTMSYGDMDLNFGMGCPLASGKNNCYVMIDETAEAVARKSDDEQKAFHTTKKNGVRLTIARSSSSGSIVFLIAQAKKALFGEEA